MKEVKNDIIAAIATPHGRGAISCVRISGEGSSDIVCRLTGCEKRVFEHSKMVSCKFSGRIKDKIMAVVYYGDRSYTGEESAELYFHGGNFLTEEALLSIIDNGARLAEAGEFTRRAFLNGKIDLTQAEGISDLIDGDSVVSLEAAYEQSEGSVKKAIDKIYNDLVTVAAKAEVCIDYPEEDIEEQTREELTDNLTEIRKSIKNEIEGYNGGRIKREGARVVITGKTNAGKSTLFNTLLKSERAIVSDEEGTTRDTIEEKLLYKGNAFVLIDTAGIRDTENRVEKMGIERSKNALSNADAIIHVIKKDSETPVKSLDENEITVINSFETIGNTTENEHGGVITLNAATGEGAEFLKEELYLRIKRKTAGGGNINNPRQYEALKNAAESIDRALAAVKSLTLDCVCADIREALDSLGKITGKNASDCVIDEIFSRFCVGK